MEKTRKKKVFLSMGLTLLLSTVTYAALPVIDITHINVTNTGFIKELAQLVLHHNYWIDIHGKWQSSLKILKVDQIVKATTKIDINKLGWDEQGPFAKEGATQMAAKSIKEVQDLMDGKSSDLGKVRDNLERIYRPAPITTDGAKSQIALQQVSEAITFVGESNKAIEENQKNIQKLKADIEAGGLRPGDLERYQVLIAAYQSQMQNYQAQAQNQIIRQQSAELGFKIAENNNKINNRLDDRYNLLEGMKRVTLTGALKKESKASTGVE